MLFEEDGGLIKLLVSFAPSEGLGGLEGLESPEIGVCTEKTAVIGISLFCVGSSPYGWFPTLHCDFNRLLATLLLDFSEVY